MSTNDSDLAPLTEENQALLDRIRERLDEIWGEGCNPDSEERLAWLWQTYGVSDEDEAYWYDLEIHYLEEDATHLLPEDPTSQEQRSEVLREMHNQKQLHDFLSTLLAKYEAKDVRYDYNAPYDNE